MDLKIKGAAFVPKQLLGISLASVPAIYPLSARPSPTQGPGPGPSPSPGPSPPSNPSPGPSQVPPLKLQGVVEPPFGPFLS